MTAKKRIFFFGELPPKTINGASISNQINISMLKEQYFVDCTEEYSDLKFHRSFSTNKSIHFLKTLFQAWIKICYRKYNFFYGVVYLSRFGMLKNILLVSVFKLFHPSSKVILHFHRSDCPIFMKMKGNQILFWIMNIFVTEYIVLAKRQIEEIGHYTKRKITLLYNCINEKDICKYPKCGPSDKINILFLSNYLKDKGIFDLIEAFKIINKKLPGQFELVCHGMFSNETDKTALVQITKFESDVILNEPVFGDTKTKILNNSDIIVLPSYNEGLPLTLLEAIFLGKPIVITQVGYIEEVLGKEYPLYCIPGEVKSIANCLIKSIVNVDDEQFSNYLRSLYIPFSAKNHFSVLLSIFN